LRISAKEVNQGIISSEFYKTETGSKTKRAQGLTT